MLAGSGAFTRDDAQALLRAGLDELGLLLDDPTVSRLLRYLNEIELWNPRLRLVAASGRDLVVRHLLDSLVGVALIGGSPGRVIADVGSGAGLPGIPLALALPDAVVHLVERSGRRVGFLRNAVAVVPVSNARVEEADAATSTVRADTVVLRAFHPLSEDLVATLRTLVTPTGCVVAYKGRRVVVDAEVELLLTLGVADVRVHPVSVPFLDEERNLVWFRPA